MIYRNLNPRGSRLTGQLVPFCLLDNETSRVSIYLFSINAGYEQRTGVVQGREGEEGTSYPSSSLSLPGNI